MKGFGNFEQIKEYAILQKPFSIERGELTPSLKVRRPIVNKMYAAEIAKLYA